jgi:hypothetical protein
MYVCTYYVQVLLLPCCVRLDWRKKASKNRMGEWKSGEKKTFSPLQQPGEN